MPIRTPFPAGSLISYADMLAKVLKDEGGSQIQINIEGGNQWWYWRFDGEECQPVYLGTDSPLERAAKLAAYLGYAVELNGKYLNVGRASLVAAGKDGLDDGPARSFTATLNEFTDGGRFMWDGKDDDSWFLTFQEMEVA